MSTHKKGRNFVIIIYAQNEREEEILELKYSRERKNFSYRHLYLPREKTGKTNFCSFLTRNMNKLRKLLTLLKIYRIEELWHFKNINKKNRNSLLSKIYITKMIYYPKYS